MTGSAYIRSAVALSPQSTFPGEEGEIQFSDDVLLPVGEEGRYNCLHPNYKSMIKLAQLRRMSPVIRMGVAASLLALREAGVEMPGAILTGSGLGCVRDTARFLEQMIENDEQLLNPTAFIQSTHNTVSGQIALQLGCTACNLTYSQGSQSFESALLDALMCLEEGKDNILLGGIDEVEVLSQQLMEEAGCVRKAAAAMDGADILKGGKGFVPGEGASFFVLGAQPGEQDLARIDGVESLGLERAGQWEQELLAFLERHDLKMNDIDLLIGSHRGDLRDKALENRLGDMFRHSTHLVYKHLVGEYDTASAFACWLAARALSGQKLPDACYLNEPAGTAFRRALIVNRGMQPGMSFILLSATDS